MGADYTPDAMNIAERVKEAHARVAAACWRAGRSPEEVTVIAICKGVPPEAISEAVAAGIHQLGENRVQEAEAKRPDLSHLEGVVWHMVGHLQTNKVKTALNLFDIIHSVDSARLAEAISSRSSRPVPVFLEVNMAGERTKSGFQPEELPQLAPTISALPNLDVRGLMTVAPAAANPEDMRPLFRNVRALGRQLGLHALSMGMTSDFEVAIEEGATHVRLGRAIFRERRAT